jgi:hypothetical protein
MKINIKRFPKSGEQKIDIQIDKFDTWNLDKTLAQIILPALIQLKESKMGIPGEFGDVGGENWSSQLSFDFYEESHKESFDIGVQRWDEVLDKIIWSFYQLSFAPNSDEKYHHGNADFGFEKTDEQIMNPVTGKMEDTSVMIDKNPDDHWYDIVGHSMHEDRIQEGIDLFAKYYRNLWD